MPRVFYLKVVELVTDWVNEYAYEKSLILLPISYKQGTVLDMLAFLTMYMKNRGAKKKTLFIIVIAIPKDQIFCLGWKLDVFLSASNI